MHKKFEINQTKIKGGCQSGRKVVTHNCNTKSDLPLNTIALQSSFNILFQVPQIEITWCIPHEPFSSWLVLVAKMKPLPLEDLGLHPLTVRILNLIHLFLFAQLFVSVEHLPELI